MRSRFALLLPVLAACAPAPAAPPPAWADYARPEPVAILGYDGEAMEPFLSRDGRRLFFNNRNDPGVQTDLFWAERIDPLRFRFRGRIAGANSEALDGVATVSRAGRFCFVSPRAYEASLSTIYCGDWRGGRLAAVTPQTGTAVGIRGRIMFDVEISADGNSLVLADGTFTGGQVPAAAELRLARRRGTAFQLSPADDGLFAAINSGALEYAAALSSDMRLLAFTRLESSGPFLSTSIWIARRERADAAFGAPVRIDAIAGELVEGPTFSADDRALYFHRREGGRVSIWRAALRGSD